MLSFLLACIIVELTPGPNMAYLAIISATQGRRAGFSLVAGISTGLLVIGIISLSGAAAIVHQSPVIYQLLRWAGVFYMFWLAWENWRQKDFSAARNEGADMDLRHFRRGFITNILNPKAVLFYMTIFPAFTDPEKPIFYQSAFMIFIYISAATFVHGSIALLGGASRHYLSDSRKMNLVRRVLAFSLFLVAIWFAWATRMKV
jgi:threonine/homoserine/homoserine lactone efflux protein